MSGFEHLKAELSGFGDLKVWSVLVTIFGDQAPHEGDTLAGTALAALTADLGIRPEALRVALHRLRKEGWIETQKSGRTSSYRLSESARAETRAVHDYIYAEEIAPPAAWYLRVYENPSAPPGPSGALELGAGLYLTDRPHGQGDAEVLDARLDTPHLPEWVRTRVMPDDIHQSYAAFLDVLDRIRPARIPNADRPALRILILHTWRRLVLRHPPLAASAMGPGWIGAKCRRRVTACLAEMPRTT